MHGLFLRRRRLHAERRPRLLRGLVVLAAALAASMISPMAAPAQGPASGGSLERWRIPLQWPGPSLHLGGALGAGLGPVSSDADLALRVEGIIELHLVDLLGGGLVVGSQGLPDALGRGKRVTTVSAQGRFRYPLGQGVELRRSVVPLLTLAVDGGGGWVSDPPPDADESLGTIGMSIGLDLVVLGRVTPFVSLGYRQYLTSGPDLRQIEARMGLSVRLFGSTHLGPEPSREPRRHPPAEPRRERESREDAEELCARAPSGSFRARLCAELDEDDEHG